jgi:hypothetical protein
MPCMTRPNLTPIEKLNQQAAIKRLAAAIAAGTVKVVVGKAGSIAFSGWKDNAGVSDLCAYRSLANSPEMRRAVMRAEAMSGNRVTMSALIAGVHSHDGGQTWGSH